MIKKVSLLKDIHPGVLERISGCCFNYLTRIIQLTTTNIFRNIKWLN